MKSIYGINEYGSGYIQLINLNMDQLPKTLTLENNEMMIVKSEFHISLVWVGRLSKMVDSNNKDKIKAEMIEEFERFTEKYSLEDHELTDKLRLVEKGDKKTIIAMAKISNLDIFFRQLSQKYGVEIPMQPTHITLYTLPTDKIGIGILSYKELQEYSKPIEVPELRKLI